MTEAMLRAHGVRRVLWLCLLLGAGSCRRSPGNDVRGEAAARVFTTICARCHGSDGKGGVPAAEGSNAPRNFCDRAFQASRSDEQLKQAIVQGKGNMPAFGNLFSDADLQGLVLQIRRFNPTPESH